MPVGFCSILSDNVKTAVCGLSRCQGDAAVRQIASMNYSYGYTIVNCLWPRYSSISQLAGVFCNKLIATQADDVFVYMSDRKRSMYYVDHLDPNLPF